MVEQNIIWQILRSCLFIFGAGFIIALQILPNNYGTNDLFFQHSLFVWCAAFLHRRPGSANDLSLVFIALLYALYIEEGLALGAIALIVFISILRYLRKFTLGLSFIVEIAITSGIYLLIIFIKNILLFAFLSPYFSFSQIITLFLSFIISYPVLNFIIVALVRSRKDGEVTI